MPKRKATSSNARAKKQVKGLSKQDTGGDPPVVENKQAVTEGKNDGSQITTAARNDQSGKLSSDCNLKICSWNVNGIKAWIKKDGHSYLANSDLDIICLQEIKCAASEIPKEIKLDGYHTYFYPAEQKGYSGTGLLSKVEPIEITYGISIDKHDNEGRVITAEYDQFFLVGAYIPNSGRKLVRLGYRQEWDADFRDYLQKLDKRKPVILCGDLNVAHLEIDLANPKSNTKTAGFTKEEREGFGKLLDCGFVDTFRHFYPNKTGAYSFWTYMSNARAKNVGWRLDYFVASNRFVPKVVDNIIRSDIEGSDHCPLELLLQI